MRYQEGTVDAAYRTYKAQLAVGRLEMLLRSDTTSYHYEMSDKEKAELRRLVNG